MKGIRKRILWITGTILFTWLLFAQGCMQFRKNDEEQIKEFARFHVGLKTATIESGNTHIHYAMTGSDELPTLYFLHGSPGSWDAFAAYMMDSQLLRKFRMVSIDRPGFGYSDFGKAKHINSQSAVISPLFSLLDNHQPAFIAGHSLGGPMVIKLVADNPGRFSALVVISGSIDPALEKPEKWRGWLRLPLLNLFLPGAFRPSNEEIWYLKTDLYPLQNDFSKISCPVYFIHGMEDTWVPPGNVGYGKKMLVHSSSIKETMIPGANHFIPWTKYEEIRQVLLKLY